MAAPAGASTALQLPKIDTFQALFQDRANDPYMGEYAAAMVYFNEDAPVQGAHAVYELVVTSSPKMGVLVGMFEDPNHEEGRSLALSGVNAFGAILGRPIKRDSRAFAFVNDVIGGQAHTVELLPEMSNRTRNDISTHIHRTIATVNQTWTSHPTDELLPMGSNGEPGLESAMTRFVSLC
jgi:hypothetical protein